MNVESQKNDPSSEMLEEARKNGLQNPVEPLIVMMVTTPGGIKDMTTYLCSKARRLSGLKSERLF